MAPAEEKPEAAETSAPVKESNEVAAPTPAQSGVSLNVSKGDDNFFFSNREYMMSNLLPYFAENYLKTVCTMCNILILVRSGRPDHAGPADWRL